MKSKFTLLVVVIVFLMQNISLGQPPLPPPLGATSSFALFTSVGAINNDGATTITGDVGTNVGPLNGFPIPGTIIGNIEVISTISAIAAADVGVAYGYLAAMTPLDVIGVGLGDDQVLGPGVHNITGAATLNGTLTLDGQNDPSSLFVIKINGNLATFADSKVVLINLADPCNVYWQINGKFDLETYSIFQGTVITSGAINLFVGSTVLGRVLSTSGAINLHTTTVTLPVCACLIAAPTVDAITQPDCFTAGSVVLGGLPEGSWTINPGEIAGTGTTKTISGLIAGTYNYTVTSGCTSEPSADVVILPFTLPDAYAAPTVGTITQPVCLVPTGSVVLDGLPDGVTWYIHPSDNMSLVAGTGTGTSTTISGLTPGTYNYTVTSAEVCYNYSAASGDVLITAVVAAPTVTVTQPTTCTEPTGTITITGSGDCTKYSLDGSDYTNTTGIFTEVPPGTYTVTLINSDGCISLGTPVTINGLPSYTAPIVGTIVQPTCTGTAGSVVLSGLPDTGTWYINPGGIAGTGTSITITGLAAGIHNYTVTSPEVCWNYSAPSEDVVINVTLAAPTVALTQPNTCIDPTGTITVVAPTGAGMTYSINGGAFTDNGTFTALVPGTYIIAAQNADNCISSGTSVTINAVPVTLAAVTAQPTCLEPNGTITVTGGTSYSIDGTDYTNTTGIFTRPAGTYTVWSKSGDCVSSGTNLTINAQMSLAAPTVTLIQPNTCISPTGTITVTALAGATYSINNINYLDNGGIFTAVPPGTYTVTAKDAAGCISAVTSVTINDKPSTLAAVTAQPTCLVATGTITVTGGTSYSIDGTDYTNTTGIFTLPAGTYPVTSKLLDCISSVTSLTINAQPASPAAPTVTVTQPTVLVPTGTITVTGVPGVCMQYSIDGSNYANSDGIFPLLPPGTYTVTAKDWLGGCISSETTVTINDVITAIEKIGADSKFDVYPVPNNGQFTLFISTLTEKNFDILINNAQGSKIYEEKNIKVNGRLEHKIDLTQAQKGMYYIILRSGNDQVTRKIIISK